MSGRAVIDMAGTIVGRSMVRKRVANSGKGDIMWECQCACGHVFERASWVLRKYQKGLLDPCGACRHERAVLRAEARGKFIRRPLSRICHICNNLPWRVIGKQCRSCGLAFAAEPPVTLATVEHSSQYRVTYPEGFSRS